MDSSEFSSMPSEPQDIGKWFSSYVYESPQLSNVDFQDSGLSMVPETQESEERKRAVSVERRNLLLCKCKNVAEDNTPEKPLINNIQLPEADESLNSIIDNLDEDLKCCSQDSCVSRVPETEESQGINRENAGDLNLLNNGDCLLNSCNNVSENNCSREVLENADSITPLSVPQDLKNWFNSYVYESPTLDTGHEFGVWSNMHRDDEDNDASNCAKRKKEALSSKSIYTVEREEPGNHRATSDDLVNDSFKDKDPKHEENPNVNAIQQVDKTNDSTDHDISCRILHENKTQGHDGKNDIKHKNTPKKKHLRQEENLKFTECTNTIDEEISGHKVADEGFISTRKSRRSKQTQKENSFKPDIQRIGVHGPSNSNTAIKKTPLKRQVLQETTNIQPVNMFDEKTGKWRCPQNSKPDIGPPLKQLRLDLWVRRVRKL